MYTDVAMARAEIMELMGEIVDRSLDILVDCGITFPPEEFCSLLESGELAKIVESFKDAKRERDRSSDEELTTPKRTRKSTSEESTSYGENGDYGEGEGREEEEEEDDEKGNEKKEEKEEMEKVDGKLNVVIVGVYQSNECQTDLVMKKQSSTQTDDVMI